MLFILLKLISNFFCILFLLQAWIIRNTVGTWLFPSIIFSMFWFVMTFIPNIVGYNVYIEPLSIIYIFLCSAAFSVSSIFFNWSDAYEIRECQSNADYIYNSTYMRFMFTFCQTIALLSIIINLNLQGLDPQKYISNYFVTVNKYLSLRYRGEFVQNIYVTIGVVCNYLGVCIGGLIFSSIKKALNKLFLVSFSLLPSVLFMLVYADKGTLFLTLAFFYAGILIYRIQASNHKLFESSDIIGLAFLGILIVVIVIISFMSRGVYELESDQVVSKLLYYFNSYAFGHMSAFSDWFTDYYYHDGIFDYSNIHTYTLGYYTYMPLFKLMGVNLDLPAGVYSEYYTVDGVISSNIYTIFRGLILDYGLIGCLLFWFFLGCVVHFSFYRILVKENAYISIAVFIVYMGFLYTSYIVSLLIWGSIYLLSLLLVFMLYINNFYYSSSQ